MTTLMIGILMVLLLGCIVAFLFVNYPERMTGIFNELLRIVRMIYNRIMIEWERNQTFAIYQNLMPYIEDLKKLCVAKYINFSNNYSLDGDIEVLRFEIYGINKEYLEDKSVLEQLLTVKLRDFYSERLGSRVPYIYLRYVEEGEFTFFVSKNLHGNKYLTYLMKKNLRKKDEKSKLEDITDTDKVFLGWDLLAWENQHLRKKITLDLTHHVHGLVTGTTGSGKSYFVCLFLHHLLHVYRDEIKLFYFDFKKSSDMSFMSKYENYYAGTNCMNGLEKYYEEYCAVRDGKLVDKKIRLLVFDEWAGYCLWLQQVDKKTAERHKGMLQEIILMGRSMLCAVWIILQRPDSVWLQGRENMMATICFLSGGVSNELSRMIQLEDEVVDEIKKRDYFDVGEAVIKLDGEKTKFMKVPKMQNVDIYKQEIMDVLAHTDG